MKTLVVYYSRTGTTKKVAEVISSKLDTDLDEIKCDNYKKGPIGYAIAGKDATLKKVTEINSNINNPEDYDLVLIGTPAWSWNVSPPVRTYLRNNKGKFKQIAFFCTMGGSGDERAFAEMQKECHSSPIEKVSFTTIEVVKSEHEEKLNDFINKIKVCKKEQS